MNTKTVTTTDLNGNHYEVSVKELTWRPTANAIIFQDDQLLVVKVDGAYHLPGGGVELGETPEAGVVREVLEETGLKVSRPQLIGSLTSFFAYSAFDSEKVTHAQSLLLYYLCKRIGGELSQDMLEDYEKAANMTPSWLPVKELGNITVGSTVDWRPIVKQALSFEHTS
ncbi:MAG TPA: NUDIX domain-containing protein [Candidatus Saccharimonadia bacterium]|nr:NUDIX domain-containing protein [Candidatus Saccharimonadia bacterium]